MGGNAMGNLINGHPMEAMGHNSSFAQAIDGQPAAALGFGSGPNEHSSSPAPAASIPQANAASVPSANNFSAIAPNLNNVSSSPSAPMAANPLATPNAPIAAAANQSSTANQTPIIAQIQHPDFQNFISSVMNNVGQSNQPGGA